MTDQIKAIKETVLDAAMIVEGKALAQIWTRRQTAEVKRFDGDIVDPIEEVLDDDGNVIVERVTGGFDRRLGKLLVAIYSTIEDGKNMPKDIAKAYRLDKIASQRKSDARKWEDMGEEMRTLLIEEYPTIKSLQRLVAKYAKMMKEQSEGEGEGEGESEGETEGETENGITLEQIMTLVMNSTLDKDAYKAIAGAAADKANSAASAAKASTEDDTKRAAINALRIAS